MNIRSSEQASWITSAPTVEQLPGAHTPWVVDLRQRAFARFAEVGLPNLRSEDWKYTRITALERQSFRATQPASAVSVQQLQQLLPLLAQSHRLVFVDGQYVATLSQLQVLPQGVILANLADILEKQPALVQPYLAQQVDYHAQGFNALNTALMTDGVYLSVSNNVHVPAPIELVFITTGAVENQVAHVRNIITLGANSQATVVENYISLDAHVYFNNVVSEMCLADNAHLTYYHWQQESPESFHIATRHVQQQQDSQFTAYNMALGGGLVRNELAVKLAQKGASCSLQGLYLAQGQQHVDHHTRIDHCSTHGTSNECYKGIISDSARAVFDGKVIVHPNAQKTDAQLSNQNLLLSDDAEVDTKPQLEIYADDVKCSHGATVGQLEDNALFYLRSRGIDEATARSLLIYAFAEEIVERIPNLALRQQWQHVLLTRFLGVTAQGDVT